MHARMVGAALLAALSAAGALPGSRAAAISGDHSRAIPAARRSPPAGAPLSGYTLGADISPANLLPGWSDQPSGRRLVALLVRDHLKLVRLLDGKQAPAAAWRRLVHGGWRTVFDNLYAARIRAVLLLSGSYTSAGAASAQAWPPEGPVVDGQPVPIPAAREMSTATWDANEAAIIRTIRAQYRGKLPRALAGVEVANEPTVDAATLPMLAESLRAMRREIGRVPVTIGGWRAPDPATGRIRYNQPQIAARLAPLVDFLSVHLYPDNEVRFPGGGPDRSSTRISAYLPYAIAYLRAVVSQAHRKPVVVGEFGARSGLDPTPYEGPGGSPAHQAAVIGAITQAMTRFAARGVTGGTVWLLVPHEGVARCSSFALICYQPRITQPALKALVSAASRVTA